MNATQLEAELKALEARREALDTTLTQLVMTLVGTVYEDANEVNVTWDRRPAPYRLTHVEVLRWTREGHEAAVAELFAGQGSTWLDTFSEDTGAELLALLTLRLHKELRHHHEQPTLVTFGFNLAY